MADAATITELRRLIHELDDTAPWTDAVLSGRIDASGVSLSQLAATIWREKAASYAELIDIQEGNSKRSMSQLHKQALAMADGLGGDVESTTRRGSKTRPIERV